MGRVNLQGINVAMSYRQPLQHIGGSRNANKNVRLNFSSANLFDETPPSSLRHARPA